MNRTGRSVILPLTAAALTLAMGAAQAQSRHLPSGGGGVYDYAPVIDVTPIVRTVRVEQPRRECWTETHYETLHHSPRGHDPRVRTAGATIAGGVIGGVVGNQFGGGRGRDAMTLFGTLVGAAVASEHTYNTQRSRHAGSPSVHYTETRPVSVERCSVSTDVREEQRLEGYDVTYLYAGREFRTRTATPPGDHLRVRVDVRPAGR